MAEEHQKSKQPGFVRFPDAHAMLDHIEREGIPPHPTEGLHQAPREVERREDMSSTGRLALLRQDDGDWIITVYGEDPCGNPESASVEFTTIGSGGGASPQTYLAIGRLALAMQADNETPRGFGARAEHS